MVHIILVLLQVGVILSLVPGMLDGESWAIVCGLFSATALGIVGTLGILE